MLLLNLLANKLTQWDCDRMFTHSWENCVKFAAIWWFIGLLLCVGLFVNISVLESTSKSKLLLNFLACTNWYAETSVPAHNRSSCLVWVVKINIPLLACPGYSQHTYTHTQHFVFWIVCISFGCPQQHFVKFVKITVVVRWCSMFRMVLLFIHWIVC